MKEGAGMDGVMEEVLDMWRGGGVGRCERGGAEGVWYAGRVRLVEVG